jgi:hypothetical protein
MNKTDLHVAFLYKKYNTEESMGNKGNNLRIKINLFGT